MSMWKRRADVQDRYRRELFTGAIVGVNADGTYDVALPGSVEPVRRVANGSGIVFQVGNRVVLHRLAGRDAWQIQTAMGQAPAVAINAAALIGPPPSGTGGLTLEDVRATTATALAAVLGSSVLPTPLPEGLGAWQMTSLGDIDSARSAGAYVYPAGEIAALRAGAYPVDPATEAYWKLDEATAETARDCSGHVHDLAVLGVAGGTESPWMRSRTWDGIAQYAVSGLLPLQDRDQLSVEAWIKPSRLNAAHQVVCQTNSFSLLFSSLGTKLRFYVTTSGAVYAEATVNPQALCDGQWHYLAGVYDGACVRLYIDGAEVGTPVVQSGTVGVGSGNGCYAGVYASAAGALLNYYAGGLDEIRVTKRARSASEIAATWANRAVHAGVSPRVQTAVACRHALVGAVEGTQGGSVSYAVSADDGATWQAAIPWRWITMPAAGTQWRVKATLTGQGEVKRLGIVCVP